MLAFTAAAGLAAATGMFAFNKRELELKRIRKQLDANVHVNGIRGKSTVTRMIGGVLRAQGYKTISKTTGTYACVIDENAKEHPIHRVGPANIVEQYEVLTDWVSSEVNATVFECMAVKPKYQQLCQDVILRSPISVITNVRLDHQEAMGETVEEIAASLCSTVPYNGTLVTSERNPVLVDIMREHCEAKGSTLVVAEESETSRNLVEQFDYLQFEENVAVVLAVAEVLGIDEKTACRGMLAAEPDPGTTRITHVRKHDEADFDWIPMFAINDWESTVSVFNQVNSHLPNHRHNVIALNNRSDRTDRAAMFVELVSKELIDDVDLVVLYGDIQDVVERKLHDRGISPSKVVKTEDIDDHDGKSLVNAARSRFTDDGDVSIFGMVNIHTEAVHAMQQYVDNLVEGSSSRAEVSSV